MAMPEIARDVTELRCPGTLQGIIRDGRLEIKCHHIRCTKGKAVNVFHYYDPQTGAFLETKVYQDPAPRLKGRKQR